jgi:hypothetical protein
LASAWRAVIVASLSQNGANRSVRGVSSLAIANYLQLGLSIIQGVGLIGCGLSGGGGRQTG